MKKKDLKSLSMEELKELFENIGEKKFRATQVFEWIHNKKATKFSDMTVLSKNLREKLEANFKMANLEVFKKFESKLDGTKKYLFSLSDGNIIETVLMKYKHGYTVCLSTQVGCKMGCEFCASTKDGLIRNLKPSEIIEQVYSIERDLDITVSNIVLMGTGEPFDNYDYVIKALEILHDPKGKNMGYRHMTVSTCGLVPRIKEFAKLGYPINLSISLHATTDKSRKEIMPITNAYSIREVIDACKEYISLTSRRVTFEYTLVKNQNDSIKDAEKLASLLRGMIAHVNIIPVNPVDESKSKRPSKESVKKFYEVLSSKKINATIRREMGTDINAACGQLRRDELKNM